MSAPAHVFEARVDPTILLVEARNFLVGVDAELVHRVMDAKATEMVPPTEMGPSSVDLGMLLVEAASRPLPSRALAVGGRQDSANDRTRAKDNGQWSSEDEVVLLVEEIVGTAMLTELRGQRLPPLLWMWGTPRWFEGIAWFQDRMVILIDVHAAVYSPRAGENR
ncbi:MAG: hypothetical protein H6729_03865 [Deltaproteobacteria bacterium]|nr:hypothetical protein [Deltaproteobacteria bacterium]